MFMSQVRSFSKYITLVLPVVLIVSILLMTNVKERKGGEGSGAFS